LKTYYDSLRKAGISIQVYAVYSELDYPAWKAYIKKNKLRWVNVAAKDAPALSTSKYYYDVNSTPTIYLLDQQKVIFGKRLDVDGLKAFLNRKIAEDKKKASALPANKPIPGTTKSSSTVVAKKPTPAAQLPKTQVPH